MTPTDPLATWQAAERHRAAGDTAAARAAYAALAAEADWALPAHLRLGQLDLVAGDWQAGAGQALRAAALAAEEADPVVLEALVDLLFQAGEHEAALRLCALPALREARDPAVQQGLGQRLLEQSFPAQARPFLDRAHALGAGSPALHYQLGLAAMYAGELDAAEQAFETCLARQPLHGGAHRQLAKLRRATPHWNHVPRLRAAAAAAGESHPDAPPIWYALFKELDDLGDTDAAWAALDTGLRLRRAQVAYDAAAEQALFDRLMRLDGQGVQGATTDGPVPVFIVGQPRSGTTLLERILAGAPDVADAGELRDFGFQARIAAKTPGPPAPDAALVDALAGVDPADLGRRYLAHTQWRAGGRRFYTDKLPANFLWLGHIARALPQARFLHLQREPMDVGFSNLKELFAGAYPHSYDQVEMAAHLRRYLALMQHWRESFPGRILDVPYEALVTRTEAVGREVFAFLGLPWQPGAEDIAARTGAVATASAVQLREPVHSRFLGQWRRYERPLQPMRDALESP